MENEIINSWQKNAVEWARIIDSGEIASREFTNKAIVNTIANITAVKILDIGCGEGWLTRAMNLIGKKAVGIDAIEKLLDIARTKGSETYYQMSYEDIIKEIPIPEAPYDAVVFNFCIYQEVGLVNLLKQIKKVLIKNGQFVIQTLHPFFLVQNKLDYKNQWIHDSWKGLPGNFIDGHSWYARTYENWVTVFKESDLQIVEIKEVCNKNQQPVSVVFIVN